MIYHVCHEEKPPEAFPTNRQYPSGKDTLCNAYAAARQQGYRRADRERWLAAKHRYYERRLMHATGNTIRRTSSRTSRR